MSTTLPVTAEADINSRHQRRMERKKALMDEKIEQAQRTTGVLIIHTGNGKGKSSSAFGMVMRALGHGMKVGVVQFIKGALATGEEIFLRRFPDEVSFHAMGEGYTWVTQNRERDMEKAALAWEQAKKFLSDPEIGLVVLDELNIALKYHYLDLATVMADLDARPEMQHVVVTGRGALPELIAIADTVSEMQPLKHAFQEGIVAQAGVEW
ncbi:MULTISPECIES: cob(I)yrinic acid a,c-diamide adenosyltransferase [unclassified Undibacterium]|uniref:cob(I)yrinic acid a,c-diamide adenosyltransferase n=1 Tax=unclassified Undibacterium TaxID=2630295 RepID=UPI002AC9E06D|nr:MULTISPECIES: cob(I)yrinic acid a,c-diamide adenosyltransferase [unclassified Undibacterium]MEB0139082.1 cob(I)yrinic acid a,c-diamide adenosyltransferase [Undibacterium sp. CCC2.1]MEB0172961.1 cob(I)yrinic acid a,c-diamide adenosyltransferase [Undibacterium sp. CCC1.1]MEB0177283.1 cob(I)yrinic acid a,c-diamide adenosyltransferase [Undibacterium sp. CCC3.4]MEB0215879.1 cob(I)yrinic acid a,c-diamide adenosyltransferase [Undibacterium sp. 5I2]WPX42082.1 cob(I)yrinic acid a,c-diamide adenosylt